METETVTETVDTLCACVNLPGHEALCPEDTDPFVCESCSEVYDPFTVDRRDDCFTGHCDECLGECHECMRPRPWAGVL